MKPVEIYNTFEVNIQSLKIELKREKPTFDLLGSGKWKFQAIIVYCNSIRSHQRNHQLEMTGIWGSLMRRLLNLLSGRSSAPPTAALAWDASSPCLICTMFPFSSPNMSSSWLQGPFLGPPSNTCAPPLRWDSATQTRVPETPWAGLPSLQLLADRILMLSKVGVRSVTPACLVPLRCY